MVTFGLAQASDGFGIGAVIDEGSAVSVAVKYNELKFDIDGGSTAIDYLFIERGLSGSFSWFMGLGGEVSYDFNAASARLPIGLDFDVSDSLDLFIELILGVNLTPNFGNFGTNVDGGIRIYF